MPIYDKFDFSLLDNITFKEDAVREDLIMPLLTELGYSRSNPRAEIISSYAVRNKFVHIGTSKVEILQIPDYLFRIDGINAWVLDAKDPKENIKTGKNVEQTYSYAIHPEIRVKYFGLCNGREFILFRDNNIKPELYFNLNEIDKYWDKIVKLLSPAAFKRHGSIVEEPIKQKEKFDYRTRPLLREIQPKKQAANRHFGVHAYFTTQAWNIVSEYIRNYTKPNDTVLDMFGGSGVTAIEAMVLDRKAINIDLNPLAVFLVDSLTVPVNFVELDLVFQKIMKAFEKLPESDQDITKALTKYRNEWVGLKGIKLDRTADVRTAEELFSNRQKAQLAWLKHQIKKVKNEAIRKSLLLCFSSTITKFNLTYHPSSTRGDNAGDASAFRYYRYRIAPQPVELDLQNIFTHKYKRLLAAKRELHPFINDNTYQNLQNYKGDATNLSKIDSESVDYIYTDPPYGSKIAYLDLSSMWSGWLGLEVSDNDYEQEAIEGGSRKKTRDDYADLLAKSIEEMSRILKFDRWLSFVFAHKDPYYWHLIVNTAEKTGFEFAGTVKQANGQSSFKKRQHEYTVLSGQLIINFKKVRSPKTTLRAALGANVASLIIETIEGIIAKNHGATLEEINDQLIIQGLELGFLDLLSKEYSDLSPILKENFTYDDSTKRYYIKEETKFKTSIPVEVRIRYYLISYLKRRKRENKPPSFDEIILDIMPLLSNGHVPEKQTILNVLETVASKTSEGHWILALSDQQALL